jgi:hypothetical protein
MCKYFNIGNDTVCWYGNLKMFQQEERFQPGQKTEKLRGTLRAILYLELLSVCSEPLHGKLFCTARAAEKFSPSPV